MMGLPRNQGETELRSRSGCAALGRQLPDLSKRLRSAEDVLFLD